MGNIYRNAHTIVRYLNGLGQDVDRNVEAWKGSRHWINRAWTLQETKPDDQMSTPDGNGELLLLETVHGTEPLQTIRQLLEPVSQLAATAHSPRGCGIIPLVRQIIGRSASNPLDQVAGINYLMWPKGSQFDLPIYNTDMSIDSSWLKCVDSMPLELKLELLFLYPKPRDNPSFYFHSKSKPAGSEVLRSIPQWIPTWKQLNSFTTDSFWDQLRLPTLSELRLASTEHPLQVPTYLSNPKVLFGTFVLEKCDRYINVLGNKPYWHIMLRGDPDIQLRGYAPMSIDLFPFGTTCYLLGLSLDIQAPWLVCHCPYIDGDNDGEVSSIVAGITVYPRTLVLRKAAVMWTDDRQKLARKFPQTMPWPKRKYDAIYIL